jgi:hypothetical protein
VAQVTQDNVDQLQNDAIATKVSITSFNNELTTLNNTLSSTFNSQEDRFFAVEEFIKTFLNTYTITKPDGNPYSYTALPQSLSFTPSDVTIIDREADGTNWKINFEVSSSFYNSLIARGGSVVFRTTTTSGTQLADVVVVSSGLNATTKKGVAIIPNSRSGSSWTLGNQVTVISRNSKNTTLQSKQFNASTLTIYTPPFAAPTGISNATFSGFVYGAYGPNRTVMLVGIINNYDLHSRSYYKYPGDSNYTRYRDDLSGQQIRNLEDSTLNTQINALFPGKKGYNILMFATPSVPDADVAIKVEFFTNNTYTNKFAEYTFTTSQTPITLV